MKRLIIIFILLLAANTSLADEVVFANKEDLKYFDKMFGENLKKDNALEKQNLKNRNSK